MYATSSEQTRRARVDALATRLYRERYEELRRLARRHGAPWIDPDEAVQDALASFVAAYDPEGGSPPLAWLGLTLKRRCWALRERHRMAHELGATPSGLGGPDEPWWRQSRLRVEDGDIAGRLDRVRETRAAMSRLEPDQRRALSLHAAGYSYRQIAGLTDATAKQVDRRLQDARAVLQAV